MYVLEVSVSPDLTPGNERSCICMLEVSVSPDLPPGNDRSCMYMLEVQMYMFHLTSCQEMSLMYVYVRSICFT
jgi:hypothetical protein